MIGEELIDIMGIFEKGLRDDVFFFEEVVDDLLETLIHFCAHTRLYNTDDFVIVLQTNVYLPHARNTRSVGTYLELIYNRKDVF